MRVVRSAGQNVSPSDDGRLFDQIFTDGLFTDASITNLGANNVALSALYGTLCGRDFTAEAQNIVVTLPEGDGEYTGYIYVEIDTSSDDVITINSALAPFTPTYEDINTNGAVVQMILAEYTATALAIQSITPVYKIASAGGLGSLAVIEASPARTNHSVGTYLVYDGMLYKVTRAIAAGEDLVVGTNISATTAGAEIVSLNNGLTNVQNAQFIGYEIGTYTTRANTGRMLINRALKMIEFNLNNILTGAALAVGTTYSLGSVTFHPYANIYANVNRQNGGNAVATLRLKTDGALDIMPLVSIPNGVGLYAHFTYFYQ